ncbi:MAG: hypothetical protein IPL65_06470 [Lewinellaceae bacterium]|nr:hypothetical protein [Lewinellaceae bacterium]
MHMLTALLPMGAMILLIAGIVYKKIKRDERRRMESELLAQQLHMQFSEKDDQGFLAQLQEFTLFKNVFGSRRRRSRIRNVLYGKVDDTTVALFDYSYVISTGKSSRRITQTVFFADDKNWYLPNFQLRPESWWGKVKQALGLQGAHEIPDNPEFSEKFDISSEFQSLLPKAFGPEVQRFLMEKPPVHLEGSNYYLLAYKPRKRLSSVEAQAFFQHCCEMVRLLKSDNRLELLNLADVQTPEALDLNAPTPIKKETGE